MDNKIYRALAPYYDRLMGDVNYQSWIEYIKKLCVLFRMKPRLILDLGCGTGSPMSYLLEQGYKVIGIDGSADMLKVAKTKLNIYNPILFQSRFQDFCIKTKVDLTISLFDSLNNLVKEDELFRTFSNVAKCLTKGGIFIFDMNTIYGLSLMNDSATFTKESDGIYSIWKSDFVRPKSLTTLHITLFVSFNGNYKRIEETHRERGYTFHTIKRLLSKNGFERTHFYEHLSFRRPGPKTKRVVVVAEKGK